MELWIPKKKGLEMFLNDKILLKKILIKFVLKSCYYDMAYIKN